MKEFRILVMASNMKGFFSSIVPLRFLLALINVYLTTIMMVVDFS